MAVTAEQRAVYDRWKPTADAAQERWNAWRAAGARSDIPLTKLRAIYLRQRRYGQRGQRLAQIQAIYGIPPFVDDGEDDLAWALDHRHREFRTRPWRPDDGEPVLYSVPTVTIIHMPSNDTLIGVPHGVLRMIGFDAAAPQDSDLYGLLMFSAHRASKGWRFAMPEHLR